MSVERAVPVKRAQDLGHERDVSKRATKPSPRDVSSMSATLPATPDIAESSSSRAAIHSSQLVAEAALRNDMLLEKQQLRDEFAATQSLMQSSFDAQVAALNDNFTRMFRELQGTISTKDSELAKSRTANDTLHATLHTCERDRDAETAANRELSTEMTHSKSAA